MRFVRPLLSSAVVASLLAVSSAASADVLPPDATDCSGKSDGASCMTAAGAAGTCMAQEQPADPLCTADAMDAGTDAAACNKTIEICVAGSSGDAGKQTGGTSDGGTSSSSDGGTAGSSGNGSSKSGGCSTTGMTASDVARAGAPFLIAALVPLALRRRKRKSDRA